MMFVDFVIYLICFVIHCLFRMIRAFIRWKRLRTLAKIILKTMVVMTSFVECVILTPAACLWWVTKLYILNRTYILGEVLAYFLVVHYRPFMDRVLDDDRLGINLEHNMFQRVTLNIVYAIVHYVLFKVERFFYHSTVLFLNGSRRGYFILAQRIPLIHYHPGDIDFYYTFHLRRLLIRLESLIH